MTPGFQCDICHDFCGWTVPSGVFTDSTRSGDGYKDTNVITTQCCDACRATMRGFVAFAGNALATGDADQIAFIQSLTEPAIDLDDADIDFAFQGDE